MASKNPKPGKPAKIEVTPEREKAKPGSTEFAQIFDGLFHQFIKSFEEEYGADAMKGVLSVVVTIKDREQDDVAISIAGTEQTLHQLTALTVAFIAKSISERNADKSFDIFSLVDNLTRGTNAGAKARLTKTAI